MNKKYYYKSFDTLRIVLICFLILVNYGLPTGLSDLITLPMNFAPGCLFAIYGYLVLRENVDYKVRIRRAFVAFILTFIAYMLLVMGYTAIAASRSDVAFVDALKSLFTKRSIFEFVVLNVWFMRVGNSIWMVQALFYALIALWIMERLKLLRYSKAICIVLFVISFLVSEGAGFIHFNILGYYYIPGNFFTRALPYMLLGKILYDNRKKLNEMELITHIVIMVVGVLLCYGELFGFSMLNKLYYVGHLLGYIPMTVAAIGLCIYLREERPDDSKANLIYKIAFYLYNPFAEMLIVVGTLLSSTIGPQVMWLTGVITVLFVIMLVIGSKIITQIKAFREEF